MGEAGDKTLDGLLQRNALNRQGLDRAPEPGPHILVTIAPLFKHKGPSFHGDQFTKSGLPV
jgi:hypothetical protein